jgi:hypothetical protein
MLEDLLNVCFKYHAQQEQKQFYLCSEFYGGEVVLGYYSINSYSEAKKTMLYYIRMCMKNEKFLPSQLCWLKERNKLTACISNKNSLFGLIIILKLVSVVTLVEPIRFTYVY